MDQARCFPDPANITLKMRHWLQHSWASEFSFIRVFRGAVWKFTVSCWRRPRWIWCRHSPRLRLVEYLHEPYTAWKQTPWATFLPLIVCVYLLSNFRGRLRKTHDRRCGVRIDPSRSSEVDDFRSGSLHSHTSADFIILCTWTWQYYCKIYSNPKPLFDCVHCSQNVRPNSDWLWKNCLAKKIEGGCSDCSSSSRKRSAVDFSSLDTWLVLRSIGL